MSNPLIYGANGYTGELIAREAVRRGLRPILAGRNRPAVERLAAELNVATRIFDLDKADQNLAGVDIVMHCAGPFSATSGPMLEACLTTGTHYLDLTGEIDIFEHAFAQNARAKAAGVVLCPGAGFDVVPTDCAAAALKQALPDATHLAVGFSTSTRTSFSPGTMKTIVEGFAIGGQIRRDGEVVRVPLAWRTRTIDFGDGPQSAMTIPLGDVSTAYFSTGIRNIEYYMAFPTALIVGAKLAGLLGPIMRTKSVRSLLNTVVDTVVAGPSDDERSMRRVHIWGGSLECAGCEACCSIHDQQHLRRDYQLVAVPHRLPDSFAR